MSGESSGRLARLAAAASLALALVASGCGDLLPDEVGEGGFDLTLDVVELVQPLSVDLGSSPNVVDQASGQTSTAAERARGLAEDREAIAIIDKASEPNASLEDVNKAIAINPTASLLRRQQAIAQVADGQDATITKGEALFLWQRYEVGKTDEEFYATYLISLDGLLGTHDVRTEEHGRWLQEFCREVTRFERSYGGNVLHEGRALGRSECG